MRLRGRHLLGDDVSIRLSRQAVPAGATQVLSTAGGTEKRLQCAQASAEGERYANAGTDAATGEDFTGCKTFPLPVGIPAGQWNVTAIQMGGNRGRALTDDGSRRVDLLTHTLYDVESLARIYSVMPLAGASTGGMTLTVRGTGFGNDPNGVVVEVAGVRAHKVEFLDPTSGPSETMLVTMPQYVTPVRYPAPSAEDAFPLERGVRLQVDASRPACALASRSACALAYSPALVQPLPAPPRFCFTLASRGFGRRGIATRRAALPVPRDLWGCMQTRASSVATLLFSIISTPSGSGELLLLLRLHSYSCPTPTSTRAGSGEQRTP